MRKIIATILTICIVAAVSSTAYAEDMNTGVPEQTQEEEQPQEPQEKTPVVVSTLEDLQAAVAAAEDGDEIALSTEIWLDGVALESNKDITLVRADTYESGTLIRMKNGAVLNGFNIEDHSYNRTIACESVSEIKTCSFVGESGTFVFISSLFTTTVVSISDCKFSGAQSSSIRIMPNTQVTIANSTFCTNSSDTQGGAINSSGTLILDSCTFRNNKAVSGGGIYSSGDLTITDCRFGGNQTENEKFGTDILSFGTLTISDEQSEDMGYYEETTGEKITLPLTTSTDTAKLIYLTSEQAAEYFAPEAEDEPEQPEDEDGGEGDTDTPTQPVEPPEQPDNDEEEETPADPEEQPEEPEKPQETPDNNGDNDYTPPVIHRPVRPAPEPTPEPEPEPAPAPSLACGDAKIDTSRSIILLGYGDGLLHEEDSLTRAQLATIVCRLLDDESIEKLNTDNAQHFADVTANLWCYVSVQIIAKAGIVCGVGGGNYDPNGTVTWAQVLTVLSRFVEQQDYTLQNITYDGWALQAVQTAAALGWIEDSAAVDPDAVISRGALVQLVNGILAEYH